MVRKIIEINEEKCNGCGACASACHEGAIEMIDGKAKLTRDDYCDGFGDCLPNCPTGAITFVEKLEQLYPEVEYVNKLMENDFGKKIVRFYDLDGNLIEVGTPM